MALRHRSDLLLAIRTAALGLTQAKIFNTDEINKLTSFIIILYYFIYKYN